jgi:hypothetical protein
VAKDEKVFATVFLKTNRTEALARNVERRSVRGLSGSAAATWCVLTVGAGFDSVPI